MTARRPLVRIGGRQKQLPAGDVLLGIPLYTPVYQQAGTLLKITLTATYGTPVYKQNGTQLTVGAVL